MIKSISFDQNEIIQWILKLHYQTDIEVDCCYSKGNFYKKGITKPKYKFDLYPQTEDTVKANCEELPLENESINTLMYDPPFLSTTGNSLTKEDSSNKINKRFGVFPTEKSLFEHYIKSMTEFHRILKPNGILIFKCQYKISSGKQYMSHVFIINEAEKLGFYTKDMFILLAKQRIMADWQLKNQKNARKFHSYFLVFEKSDRKIKYI